MPEPRPTLVQVAARAGVSKTTAGYVLTGRDQEMRIADATRHKVLRAAAEMNYRPNVMARSLRTTVQRPIAVLTDTLVTEPYGGELVAGCLAGAAEAGRVTFIGETRRDPHLQDALVEQFLNDQIEDFVFAGLYPRELELPAGLQGRRIVMANCAATDPDVAAVLPDEVQAGRLAASVVSGPVHLLGDRAPHPYAPGRDRERGLREAGVEVAGALDCAWEPEAAFETLRAALDDGLRPTTLVCLNDRVALGAYQALAEVGLRVPDDVAVLGFEASPLAEWLRPALTSVDRQLHLMGRRAVERLAEDAFTGPEHVPLVLRRRASTR